MTKDSDPLKIEDRHLLAYLDGEADAETVARIEASEEFLKRARQLDQLQKRLKGKLYRVNCPETIELGEFHLGLLGRKKSKEIERHLKECHYCRRELLQLQNYLKEDQQPEKPRRFEGIKVLIARLVGDFQAGIAPGELALQPATATLRGNLKGLITLEADGTVILLDPQPVGEGKVQVLGQVVADDLDQLAGAAVELNLGGSPLLKTALDDLGAFHFEGLEFGLYELVIAPAEGPVILANIEIVG